MRYFGQNYENEVEIDAGALDEAALDAAFRRFDAIHAERYGYLIEGEVIELVSFKVTAIGPRPPLDLGRPERAARAEPRPRDVFVRGDGFRDAIVVHRSAPEPGAS